MRTLQRASYRGVPFWVETDQVQGGRRLVVHEFPHRDAPYVEDMGRSAVKVQLTAYLASDAADAEAARLRAACEAGSAARLVLPLETLTAHCESYQRDFSKDRLGYIAIGLSFVRDGAGAAPYPSAYHARLVTVGVGGLAAPLAALHRRRFRGRRVAGYVRDSAAEAIREAAAALDVARGAVEIAGEDGAGVARRVADLHDDAALYAEAGEIADVYESTRADARQSADTAPDLAAEVVGIVDAIVAGAGASAADPLAALAGYRAHRLASAYRTPSRRQEAVNAHSIAQIVRVPAAAAAVAAILDAEITDRRAAIAARSRIVGLIDTEIALLDGPGAHDVRLALVDVRDNALAALTRLMTDLAPVLTVTAARRMPSLWWSQRLYGSAHRAREIAARALAWHPGMMPETFEALGR